MKMKLLLILCFIISVKTLYSQDVLFLNDGTEIKSKIVEITTQSIKYRKHSQSNGGPIRSVLISDTYMVIYEDGTREMFKGKSKVNEVQKNKISTEPVINYSVINYNDVLYLDNRENTLIIGEDISSGISIVPVARKIKDEKGTYFSSFQTLFNDRLVKSKYKVNSDSNLLEIQLNKLFYKTRDKAFYKVIDQLCSVTVVLKNTNNEIMYSKEFKSVKTSKLKDLRKYLDLNGYKINIMKIYKEAPVFLMVIDDIINQLKEDELHS